MTEVVLKCTPVERYQLHREDVYVKREDKCAPYPGPAFSKIRGVEARMRSQQEQGKLVFGAMDTYHSKAGWAVAYVAYHLGLSSVVYWPRYKADPPEGLPRWQQLMADSFGARMIEVPAGRSFILFKKAQKHLRENIPDSYMMPNALKMEESVEETANEVIRSHDAGDLPKEDGTWLLPISSGTLAAGVLRGLYRVGRFPEIVLHMGYSRSPEATLKYVEQKAGIPLDSFPGIRTVDEGFNYKDHVEYDCPFPSNPYYDLKTWRWLDRNLELLESGGKQGEGDLPAPYVFWNIGA